MSHIFQEKPVLVIGLGISGRSAAALLLKQNVPVYGVDGNRDLIQNNEEVATLRAQGLLAFHDTEVLDIQRFGCVVVSPGIPPSHRLFEEAKALGLPIIGEVELACRLLKGTYLGITGTNGKTTVTLLTAHVLQHCGLNARALGNVGTPLTSQCLEKSQNEFFVIELSSYQLDTMDSQVLDAAVLLNITPDHLDRYSSMEAYAASKMHIIDIVKPGGLVYIEQKCWTDFGYLRSEFIPKRYGYSPDCELFTDLKHLITGKKIECILPSLYQGKMSHDLENIMAAYALCRYIGVAPEQFMEALATFQKPSHRIEFVREVNQVSYYDDSKGTNIDAVVRAVETINGKIVLVAGGVDKGSAYTPWIAAFADKVKCICAIGQAAPKIRKDLDQAIPVMVFSGLEEAVNHAAQIAKSGETVLLSPGCSSFDMFRDYAHRGEEFQRIVRGLKNIEDRERERK